MIICELDDMIFNSASIQSLKERFDDMAADKKNDNVSYMID